MCGVSPSRQAVDAPQAPFGQQADDGDQEIKRLMPERRRPRLGDRCLARGEAGDERVEASPSTTSPPVLPRSSSGTPGRAQAGKLVGRRLGRPARLRARRPCPVGRGRRGDDAVGAGCVERTSPRTLPASRASGSASSVSVVARRQGDPKATLALSSGRYSASRTRTADVEGRRSEVGLGAHGDFDAAGHVADQPADGLAP